jgi:hypothetical protein
MNIHTLLRLSRMVLLAVAVSVAILALMYLMQHPQLILAIATVSWNG